MELHALGSIDPMTLVNAWWERDRSADRQVRRGLVQCDQCMNRRWAIEIQERRYVNSTAELMHELGWRFKQFEMGLHVCPICARPRHRSRWRFQASHPVKHPALPTLLIIGAGKCGTTSLHRYLGMHPDIHMSEPKEVNFFQDPECLGKMSVYASYFDADAPVRREASPIYTCHPITRGVPERVRAAVPDAKLIYMVRDPVERLSSLYVDLRSRGFAPTSLEAWLGDIDNPYNRYLATSRYATQLEQYLAVFPPEQLLVIDQVELRESRAETLRKVFGFVGVDEDFAASYSEHLYNTSETKRRSTRAGTLLRESPLANAMRMLPPSPREAVFRPARRVLSRKVEPPAVDEGLRERLRDVLRDEVRRLREMTGQEFASWQI